MKFKLCCMIHSDNTCDRCYKDFCFECSRGGNWKEVEAMAIVFICPSCVEENKRKNCKNVGI